MEFAFQKAYFQSSFHALLSTGMQLTLIQGTTRFFTLIEAFCKMLDALPHDQVFSQLIISQIVGYYDKCYGWYKGMLSTLPYFKILLIAIVLVTRGQPNLQTGQKLKLAAVLNEDGELKGIVDELEKGNKAKISELIGKASRIAAEVIRSGSDYQQETESLLKIMSSTTIQEPDLILDRRNIAATCLLYTSMVGLPISSFGSF